MPTKRRYERLDFTLFDALLFILRLIAFVWCVPHILKIIDYYAHL